MTEEKEKIKEKVLLRSDEFEKDIKEFQNFGVKSKVIIRLNQLRREIEVLK